MKRSAAHRALKQFIPFLMMACAVTTHLAWITVMMTLTAFAYVWMNELDREEK